VAIVVSPHHLDERVPGLPVSGRALTPDLPDADLAIRLLTLYTEVANLVAISAESGALVTVVAADCMTSLGVLAGLQRSGLSPGVVWLDAHGDFNTPATTRSGYLGGMPLAVAVGHDARDLGAGLGLTAVDERRVLLAGVRDLDVEEGELLASSAVKRASIPEVGSDTIPPGPIYLHVDVDVIDPEMAGDLLYPVASGPSLEQVAAAIGRVLDTGQVVAVGLACNWKAQALATPKVRSVVERLRLPVD
jgi:arginase